MISPTLSGLFTSACHSPSAIWHAETCSDFSIAWRVASLMPRGEACSRIGRVERDAACDVVSAHLEAELAEGQRYKGEGNEKEGVEGALTTALSPTRCRHTATTMPFRNAFL